MRKLIQKTGKLLLIVSVIAAIYSGISLLNWEEFIFIGIPRVFGIWLGAIQTLVWASWGGVIGLWMWSWAKHGGSGIPFVTRTGDCPTCNGRGQVTQYHSYQQGFVKQKCFPCGGTGRA